MNDLYSVIAYIARYWFLLLIVVIIGRAVLWLREDAVVSQRASRRLPDAGFIGEWAVVSSDAKGITEGMVIRAPRDGWIGSARACDVRLRDTGVPARAARFTLKKDGLYLSPTRAGILSVDSEPVQRVAVLRHGATVAIGGVTLQLQLFAGVVLRGEAVMKRKKQAKLGTISETKSEAEVPAAVMTELPKPVMTVRLRGNRKQTSDKKIKQTSDKVKEQTSDKTQDA